MRRPVRKFKPALTNRLAFLFIFTLFYWGYHFIYQKTSLQLSQVIFNLTAGVFAGAVMHVAAAKFFGPLLLGRSFCGWACWNASVFDILPVRKQRRRLPDKYFSYKFVVLLVVLVLPFPFIAAGLNFQGGAWQFKWLLTENLLIYVLGIILTFVLGDRRAFCKYICPAGALMTFTSPRSILKVEKNHLQCNKCRKCEEVCPMDVPVLSYISANQRVSHPECILCAECIRQCPKNCLTMGIGRKSRTTPEFGKSY